MVPRALRTAWIAPPLLALLIVPMVIGVALGSRDRGAAFLRGADQAAAESRPLTACPAGSAALPAATGPVAWTLQPDLDHAGTLAGWTLRTAVGGGADATLRLNPESAARGPVNGLVAVATDDGQRSRILSVVAAAGCVATVRESPDVIRQAIVDPGSGDLIFHAVRRADRADLGIWRANPGLDAPPRQVLPALGSRDPVVRDVGPAWSTELVVSVGGRWLAAQTCGAADCRVRLVDLETAGPPRTLGQDQGPVVGLDSEWLVTLAACRGLPCPVVVTNIEDGRQRILVDRAWSASTLTREGRLLVIATVGAGDEPSLIELDAATGARRPIAQLVRPVVLLPRAGASIAGVEAGPTAVPALAEPDSLPIAVDLAGQVPAGGITR